MIKFFRHIRQMLLKQKRFSQYLLYAFGEIILVVVGILIALQINNQNQYKEDRALEKHYLISISNDFDYMAANTNSAFLSRFEKKIECLYQAKEYFEQPKAKSDTMAFLNNISYGAVGSAGFTMIGKGTYQELLSTGSLRLIRNDSLRKNLSLLFNNIEMREEVLKNFSSEYLPFINSLRPFDSQNPDYISPYDQIQMMEALKTEQFGTIVDHELSYAYKVIEEGSEILKYISLVKKQITEELLEEFQYKIDK